MRASESLNDLHERITMNTQECFKATKRFDDKINFPYGFARSGEFTREQAQILEARGQAYLELDTGSREPVAPEEQSFVEFCIGNKPAESKDERIWQRYKSKIERNHLAVSFNKGRASTEYEMDWDEAG
jgi:uncharacterized protein YifE (UPF0438 family)